MNRFGVVILAAGASSRMGRPKLALPWGKTTIIGNLISTWRELGVDEIAVVCASENEPVHAALNRVAFPISQRVINPVPARGMFSSIQSAASWPGWSQHLSHFVIALGDQPGISVKSLRLLLDFVALNPDIVCQPMHEGRRCHPIVLPRLVFEQVIPSEKETFREFLEPFERACLRLDDEQLAFDIDRPEDYERAVKEASART
jgi:molybdenum cofactor cytidylyltransferase